ncbi:MAG: OAM dimerization domain-containing protein [Bradymonadaceae bacterium]
MTRTEERRGRTGATAPDPTRVRPYGDTLDDGQIQLSFTLPVPHGEEAREAAHQVLRTMGLSNPRVYHMKDLGEGYTYVIAYGEFQESIDFTAISVPRLESTRMDFYEVNAYITEAIGRKVTILGACTGTDAHSVGIDAIMNMKGFAGEYGLERYPMVNAHNLGMQVRNEDLIALAIEKRADALLVSQVVTQKDIHVRNLSELIDMLEAEGIREKLIVVCGGPRITHELALELGFDAGFGSGTTAPDVAGFVAQELVARRLI